MDHLFIFLLIIINIEVSTSTEKLCMVNSTTKTYADVCNENITIINETYIKGIIEFNNNLNHLELYGIASNTLINIPTLDYLVVYDIKSRNMGYSLRNKNNIENQEKNINNKNLKCIIDNVKKILQKETDNRHLLARIDNYVTYKSIQHINNK
jgi:hypothetical protein